MAKPVTKQQAQVIQLKQGDKNVAVERLHEAMKALGETWSPDGNDFYGPGTKAAVKRLQKKGGLKEDGIVGPITIQYMMSIMPKPEHVPATRGRILDLSVKERIDRALSQVRAPIKYHLEYPNGGTDPGTVQKPGGPCDPDTGLCDCVGFVAWAQGFDRFQPSEFPYYDGYINTDSMIDVARGIPQLECPGRAEALDRWFTKLDKPEPGCMIVGHTYSDDDKQHIGHIGVVIDVSEYATRGLSGITVVHCSPSNYQYSNNESAIWKTSGIIWEGYRKAQVQYFIRFNAENFANAES